MNSEAKLTVLLADTQPIWREGVGRAIKGRPQLKLVGQATSGPEALRKIEELRPDIVVLDADLPEISGLAILRALAEDPDAPRGLLVSVALDGSAAYEAIAAGAAGLVSRKLTADALADAVAAIGRGETVLHPSAQSGLAAQIKERAHAVGSSLSSREVEILQRIANGEAVDEIAGAMGLSVATIRAHLRAIYEKLRVPGQPAAIAEAMRRGLIR